ncbi:uncharacterized protein LOC100824489 [Brachypodium distachyon]|uniref:uncharacterized protein LOC100824489 n=1 Tax=Brachypodium distachyon TaxID=15368 RepID=UPI000D0E02E6|nr:uncharacterized protein LOC100824489 [Brachypodium distachyon]|eukprot:XP_024314116.1 uncharacterized protein LOC100824489 [Brachypodium distachyon]
MEESPISRWGSPIPRIELGIPHPSTADAEPSLPRNPPLRTGTHVYADAAWKLSQNHPRISSVKAGIAVFVDHFSPSSNLYYQVSAGSFVSNQVFSLQTTSHWRKA